MKLSFMIISIEIQRGMILMIENNRSNYEKEKEARERRLRAYAEEIQKQILYSSGEIVHQLVEEYLRYWRYRNMQVH